jgi:hypothetical protein
VTAEEQLWQEQAARQEAEGQLHQDWAALVEVRAALERERLARKEALGQLQQERAALEGAQATLKEREDEVSRLNGELVETCISLSLEEQGATVLGLQQAAEDARQALEAERKQVEGKLSSAPFRSPIRLSSSVCLWGSSPNFLSLVRGFQACGSPWETPRSRPKPCKRPTTPRNKSWRSCGSLPSRFARR